MPKAINRKKLKTSPCKICGEPGTLIRSIPEAQKRVLCFDCFVKESQQISLRGLV